VQLIYHLIIDYFHIKLGPVCRIVYVEGLRINDERLGGVSHFSPESLNSTYRYCSADIIISSKFKPKKSGFKLRSLLAVMAQVTVFCSPTFRDKLCGRGLKRVPFGMQIGL
jgi:hypothetical protein